MLHLEFSGGVVVPNAVLNAGWRADLGASAQFGGVPVLPVLKVGFEQHTGQTAALIPPAGGGLDPALLAFQSLVPLELGLTVRALDAGPHRLDFSALFGLLVVNNTVTALGATTLERGLGEDVVAEGLYAYRFGTLAVHVRLRWSLRHTQVGRLTTAAELPWYQSFGALAGVSL